MKRPVVRFTLITLIGVSLTFAVSLVVNSAKNQQAKRTVVRKPWPVEPVRVVAIKTKNKMELEIGKAIEEDDDWLDGFTVTVANNYDKTVTVMTVAIVFRREPGDTRAPLVWDLHFGPRSNSREYTSRDPNKVIKVGKTADFRLSQRDYEHLTRGLEQADYPNTIQRVELEIREVGFEDGSMLYTGTFYLQDPANPEDPTKKIRVRQPGAQNQRMRGPPQRNNALSSVSFLKSSFILPNRKSSLTLPSSIDEEDCYAQEGTHERNCFFNSACIFSEINESILNLAII